LDLELHLRTIVDALRLLSAHGTEAGKGTTLTFAYFDELYNRMARWQTYHLGQVERAKGVEETTKNYNNEFLHCLCEEFDLFGALGRPDRCHECGSENDCGGSLQGHEKSTGLKLLVNCGTGNKTWRVAELGERLDVGDKSWQYCALGLSRDGNRALALDRGGGNYDGGF